MENVIEYIFVGFMLSILLSSSLVFIEGFIDRYNYLSNFEHEFIYDYIFYSLAPEGRIDPLFLQSLSYNYSLFSGYYWSYEDIKALLGLYDNSFSLCLSPSLRVFVNFTDGFVTINSFDNQYMKPCGDEGFIYVFNNGSLHSIVHTYLVNGFSKFKLDFKPEFVIAFIKWKSLFGLGLYGRFRIFHGFIPSGALYLSSFEFNRGYYAIDGIAGSPSFKSINGSELIFYTRVFEKFKILSGSMNVTVFVKGFGNLQVSFGVCTYNFSNTIFLVNSSFPVNYNEVSKCVLMLPIMGDFHGENMRFFLKFFSNNNSNINVYFGGWDYPSKFTLNCDLPVFSQNICFYNITTESIWIVWFDRIVKVDSNLCFFKPPFIVISIFNELFYVAFIPELNVHIGFMNYDDFIYRFFDINGYYLIGKISLKLAFNNHYFTNFSKIKIMHSDFKWVNINA